MYFNNTIIIVTVYNRLTHLKQCLESLEKAKNSDKYSVVVGSDSALTKRDKKDVDEIREYLKIKKLDNKFKCFVPLFHEKNLGADLNTESCHQYALNNNYDSFIFMEDDVIVGQSFLNYIQDSLVKYADNKDVIAVRGYRNPNLKQVKSNKAYLHNRFSAYGFASWYNKWIKVTQDLQNNNYPKKLLMSYQLFKVEANISENVKSYPFLAAKYYSALDLEMNILMRLENLWVVAPPRSLTANRGLDGSGLRSGKNLGLQQTKPSSDHIVVPEITHIEYVRYEDICNPVNLRDKIYNYSSFVIYRYLPYGFKTLKTIRAIKRL